MIKPLTPRGITTYLPFSDYVTLKNVIKYSSYYHAATIFSFFFNLILRTYTGL